MVAFHEKFHLGSARLAFLRKSWVLFKSGFDLNLFTRHALSCWSLKKLPPKTRRRDI